MRRTLTVLTIVCLAVGCAAALSYSARAADETPVAPTAPGETRAPAEEVATPEAVPVEDAEEGQLDTEGAIKELNIEDRTMTVAYTDLDENNQEVEKSVALKIDENAKVSIDDAEAQLKDIRVGDQALVTYTQDEKGAKTVTEIIVIRKKDQNGFFKSADVNAKQLVIEIVNVDENGKETREAMSFELPADVPVTIEGNEAALKDILAGDEVWVTYLEDTPGKRVVTAIDVTREFAASGAVKTLDINGKKLVVSVVGQDAEGNEVTQDKSFDLGAEVAVTINNEESKLEQVKAGDDVWIAYTQAPGGPMTVTQIEVQRPQP